MGEQDSRGLVVSMGEHAVIGDIQSYVLEDPAQPEPSVRVRGQPPGSGALDSLKPGIGGSGMDGIRIGIEPGKQRDPGRRRLKGI